jgi:predicted RNA-binding Zn-ribbon protein involved in translation (DUF1610 family)
MPEPHQPIILGCVPVGAPGYTPGPDYTRIGCTNCGRAVWIRPKQRAMRRLGYPALCPRCFVALTAAEGMKEARVLNPGAGSHCDLDELNRAIDAGEFDP